MQGSPHTCMHLRVSFIIIYLYFLSSKIIRDLQSCGMVGNMNHLCTKPHISDVKLIAKWLCFVPANIIVGTKQYEIIKNMFFNRWPLIFIFFFDQLQFSEFQISESMKSLIIDHILNNHNQLIWKYSISDIWYYIFDMHWFYIIIQYYEKFVIVIQCDVDFWGLQQVILNMLSFILNQCIQYFPGWCLQFFKAFVFHIKLSQFSIDST